MNDVIHYKNVCGHIEVYRGHTFLFSADTLFEARMAVLKMED